MFMEMNRNLNNKRHMMIECVPVDKEVGDLAPIYFKVRKGLKPSPVLSCLNKGLPAKLFFFFA